MTAEPDGMRRQDREILDRRELDELLHAAAVCRLALARHDEPYLVPLSFGYDGRRLYFHTALSGRKLDFVAHNPRVCFEVEEEPQVVEHAERGCAWGMAYASVIGYGRLVELQGEAERKCGLDEIMRHYSGRADWPYAPAVLARTRVWALEIDSLTGKRAPGKPEEV